jgi:FlgD Ig-like domain
MCRRSPLGRVLILVLPFLLTVSAAPAHAAWPHDPAINLRVSANAPLASISGSPSGCPDGAGGCFVVWENYVLPSGTPQVYLQHITLAGTLAPGWPAVGISIAPNPSSGQIQPALCPDGAGGVYVVWTDSRNSSQNDIYAQRVTSTGSVQSGWPATGLRVTSDPHSEITPIIASDGAGGAFVTWTLVYNGPDIDTWIAALGPAGVTNTPFAVSNGYNSEHAEDLAVDSGGNVFVSFAYDSSSFASVQVVKFDHSLVRQWGGVPWQAYANASGPTVHTARLCLDGRGYLFLIASAGYGGHYGLFFNSVQVLGPVPQPQFPYSDTSDLYFVVDVVPDPNGGCYFTFDNSFLGFESHIAHIRGDGFAPYPWTLGYPPGMSLDHGTGAGRAHACSDGANGVLTAYQSSEAWGTRIGEDAAFAPGWAGAHTLLSNVIRPLMWSMVSDGQGGGYAIWVDQRDAPNIAFELFAQHVDRFGALGDASPHIVSIKDVPADQGGSVKLVWTPSYLDSGATRQVNAYWIWREVPATLAEARVTRGARWADGPARVSAGTARPGMLYRHDTTNANAAYAWEYVDSQPANTFPQYSYVASTTNDSMPGPVRYTRYMVEARDTGGLAYWDSAPDSGLSVDNLPPAVPSPFTANYHSGVTALAWGPNHESDLAGYRLYRGATAGFVPGPSNRISDQPNPDYSDVAPTGSWYKLSAYDLHGNESGYATLGPSGILAVDGAALPAELALDLAGAMPSRGPVGLRLALPTSATVRVEIYDASGRRVRLVAAGEYPAGVHDLDWDTRDDGGHALASGLYFARLDTPGRMITRRIALVK